MWMCMIGDAGREVRRARAGRGSIVVNYMLLICLMDVYGYGVYVVV